MKNKFNFQLSLHTENLTVALTQFIFRRSKNNSDLRYGDACLTNDLRPEILHGKPDTRFKRAQLLEEVRGIALGAMDEQRSDIFKLKPDRFVQLTFIAQESRVYACVRIDSACER